MMDWAARKFFWILSLKWHTSEQLLSDSAQSQSCRDLVEVIHNRKERRDYGTYGMTSLSIQQYVLGIYKQHGLREKDITKV